MDNFPTRGVRGRLLHLNRYTTKINRNGKLSCCLLFVATVVFLRLAGDGLMAMAMVVALGAYTFH